MLGVDVEAELGGGVADRQGTAHGSGRPVEGGEEAVAERLDLLPAVALEARSYKTGGTVVFDVTDPFCEWNKGRWKLDAGSGKVSRTREEADIACTINELGATYLGETTFTRLHDAGRVQELRKGALKQVDAMFRCDRAPWIPENF